MIKAIITGMILVVALMAESQANYLNDDQNMISVIKAEVSIPNSDPVSLGMNPGMDISLPVKSEQAPTNAEVNDTATQSADKESRLRPSQISERKSLRLLCLFAMLKSNGSARVLR